MTERVTGQSPRWVWVVFILMGWAAPLHAGAPGAGSDESPEGRLVVDVQIRGNELVGERRILDQVRTRPGSTYSIDVVDDDVRRIYALDRFQNAYAEFQIVDNGVVVVFNVAEQKQARELRFSGNKALSNADLLAEVDFRAGDFPDRYTIGQGKAAIERRYRQIGYNDVAVTINEEAYQQQQRVEYVMVEGPKIRIDKILFDGNNSFSRSRLKRVLAARQYIFLLAKGILNVETIEDDVNKLRVFYNREGFLDAEIDYILKKSFKGDRYTVTFAVNEGDRYKIKTIVFEGNERWSSEKLKEFLVMKDGDDYLIQRLHRDRERIKQLYGAAGYIYCTVSPAERFTDEPGYIDLVYNLTEGEAIRVGRVIVRGNVTTHDKVVRRSLNIFSKSIYSLVAAENSESRLINTRLFNKATITPVGDTPGVRDALVEVEEGTTATFLVGVGVTSNAGVLGQISLEQRNFDLFDWPETWGEFASGKSLKGAGQRFLISAEPGTEINRFRIAFTEPYAFDQPVSFGTSVFLFTRGRRTFNEERLGVTASLGKRFVKGLLKGWNGELAALLTGVDIGHVDFFEAPRDVLEVEGEHLLTSGKLTMVHSTVRRDRSFTPYRGALFSSSFEQTGVFGGDFDFRRAITSYRWYKSLREDIFDRKSVLMVGGSAGFLFGDSPVFERFYGGGIGTVRGFDFRGIGPRQPSARAVTLAAMPGSTLVPEVDEAVGGDFRLVGTAEFSFPLVGENLRGVTFVDVGTVEKDIGEITKVRSSLGVGLRVTVPFFGPVPLSFDFAVPMSKADEDEEQIFSFSLGAQF